MLYFYQKRFFVIWYCLFSGRNGSISAEPVLTPRVAPRYKMCTEQINIQTSGRVYGQV